MNTDTDIKRGPGRPRKETSQLDTLKATADALADAVSSLTPAESQRLNITLNGNHEITTADVLRIARAVAECVNTTKPI